MNRSFNKFLSATVVLTTSFCAASLRAEGEDEDVMNVPAEKMAWEVTEEGVGFAPLLGERFNEAYMAMVTLPAGLVSPAHVKSANMFGVVISGTLTHQAVGANADQEIPLSEGSFYKVPAGVGHVSKCISAVDCVTFLYQDGKFDFVPVKP